MKRFTLQQWLFGVLLGVLLFPLCFQLSNGTITPPLKGYQPQAKAVSLTPQNLLNNNWQTYAEAYTKDHLQTRHFLIRLNNQLKYSLFDHLNAQGIERGKDNFYFENRYIHTYLGQQRISEEDLISKVSALRDFADSLHDRGVATLVVLAPGKAQFMPENLPTSYDTVVKQPNNYEAYRQKLEDYRIPFLDIQKYLLEMKDTTAYPLFTRGNVHWSFYAMSYVTDTLIGTIETLLQRDLPDYQRDTVSLKYSPTYYTEAGIFASLNLYWTQLQDTFAYRHINPDSWNYENKYRPKVWAIGDSFYGTLLTYDVPQRFFDPSSIFFYYNNSVVSSLENKNYTPGKITDYLDQLAEQDLVIIMTTDANIKGCTWGATGDVLREWRKEED